MTKKIITLFTKQMIALKNNYLVISFAILVAIIYFFPHIYFANKLGENYKGIYMSRSYDEDTYYSAVRQVYDGKSPTDNPYIVESNEKTIVSNYKFLEYVVGLFGKFLDINISTLALLSKFIFPILTFLSVYFFILFLMGNKSMSLLAGVFTLLGQEFAPLNIASAMQTFLFNSPFRSFLFFNRPINPQISFILFILTLYLLVRFWKKPESYKYAIWSGISIGFLSYIYFYFWNFTMILTGLIFVYAIFIKNKSLLKGMFITLTTSLVVAGPFILNTIRALQSSGLSIEKNYLITHRFINETVIILPLLIFTFMYIWNYLSFRKYIDFKEILAEVDKKGLLFVFLLVLTGFVATNQQMVHGYEIQQHHYHFMTNIPVFIVAISVIFVGLLDQYFKKIKLILLTVAIIAITIHGISIQVSSYKFWQPSFTHYQNYNPVFQWLNQNTKVDDVVYANITISEIITVYTHNSVYTSLHASVYPVPVDRLAHNYFTMMYLKEVDEFNVKDYLYKTENRNEFGQLVFEGQYWRSKCGSFGCFPDSTLDVYVEKYKIFLENSFEKNFKKYKIDYILWDSKENPEWDIDKFKFVKEVYRYNDVYLFSII